MESAFVGSKAVRLLASVAVCAAVTVASAQIDESPAPAAAPVASAAVAPAPRTVVLIQLEGWLGPAEVEHVRRGLALAALEKAQLVVLQIDTSGGSSGSVRGIVQDILDSDVPVATFAAPEDARVGGAGIWLLYASPIAAMTPSAVLGKPVPAPAAMRLPAFAPLHRTEGDASRLNAGDVGTSGAGGVASGAGSLTRLWRRNADWPGQAMVERVPALPAVEALQRKVVSHVAPNVADLLLQLNGQEVQTTQGPVRLSTQRTQLMIFAPDWRVRLLSIVADPVLARLLLMLGICGLLLQFTRPGWLLPGVVGAASATAALFGLYFLEANLGGLALVAVGVGLVVLDGFRPGFGAPGFAGALALAIGTMIVVDPSGTLAGPQAGTIGAMSAVSAIFILGISRRAARVRRRAAEGGGVPTLVGSTGELVDFADGEGWAQIQGDYWPVTGMGDLRAGETVRVSAIEGSGLKVASHLRDRPGKD